MNVLGKCIHFYFCLNHELKIDFADFTEGYYQDLQ